MASKESLNLIDLAKEIEKITKNFSPYSGAYNGAKGDVVGEASRRESAKLLKLLKSDLYQLRKRMIAIEEYYNYMGEEVSNHIRPLEKVLQRVGAGSSKTHLTKGMKKDLDDINTGIFNMVTEFPLLPVRPRKPKGSDSQEDGDNDRKQIVRLPGIHSNEDCLKRLAVFRDVQETFKNTEWKLCLLSFAMFPENQEVNRTMLMYWWIGEGILPDKVKPEVAMKNILKEFTDKKLIEPVENKRKVEPNSYKMTPVVHASVVLLSKEFMLFDIYGHEKRPTVKQSGLNKVCLLKWSSNQAEAKTMQNVHQIETVFNVAERFPEFTFKWFAEDQALQKKTWGRLIKTSYMALKVFYLGRWERTPKRHIEVQNSELMINLKHMTKLRLLSFQGITGIVILDDAVCKLHDLIILDLRACYYLEKLPEKIDSLKALIYLDITDCYMIDQMPKRLSWLENLEVLKGFVVSDATDEETVCTLVELKHLKKLRKLSITVKTRNFSVLQLFLSIKDLKNLENLKMVWGDLNERAQDKSTATADTKRRADGFFKGISGEKEKNSEKTELPKTLKKLDLQCFPDSNLPEWIEPEKLLYLEKLYLKGGRELTGFGKVPPEQLTKCSVEVLRLKFLPRLKVEWRDLSISYFPKLNFLEKYQCPQVSFCPTDGLGIWRRKHQV